MAAPRGRSHAKKERHRLDSRYNAAFPPLPALEHLSLSESPAAPAEASRQEPQSKDTVAIDHLSFPHIWNAVLQHADRASLLAIRCTSTSVRDRVDKMFVGEHIRIGKHVTGDHGRIPRRAWYKVAGLAAQIRILDIGRVPSAKKQNTPNSCGGCTGTPPGLGSSNHRIADVRDITTHLSRINVVRFINPNCDKLPVSVAPNRVVIIVDLPANDQDGVTGERPLAYVPWLPTTSSTEVVLNLRYVQGLLYNSFHRWTELDVATAFGCNCKHMTLLFTPHMRPVRQVPGPMQFFQQGRNLLDQLCAIIASSLATGTEWHLVDVENWRADWMAMGGYDFLFPPSAPAERNKVKLTTLVIGHLIDHCGIEPEEASTLTQAMRWSPLAEYRSAVGERDWALQMGK